MIEKRLIDSCRNGEHKGFKECYETCAPYVFSIIKNYISRQEDRKDVMQEVFANVFHAIHKYDENKASFKTWLSRITLNQTITYLKKTEKLKQFEALENDFDVSIENEDLDVEKLNTSVLDRLIKMMPQGYRTIFLLSFVEGYSHKEISQILEISPQTSRSQLSRGLKWLKVHYKKSS